MFKKSNRILIGHPLKIISANHEKITKLLDY